MSSDFVSSVPFVRFEVFMAMKIEIAVFWIVTLYSVVLRCLHF